MRRKCSAIRVSDHALVRFLERAGGFELESLRERIGASIARATAAAGVIGARAYRVHADGLIYIVRDGVVVTIECEG